MTACWMNLGQNLKVNAKKFPNTVCLKDSRRSFTYPQTNTRVNRLSHRLTSLGLSKGDKLAVLLENILFLGLSTLFGQGFRGSVDLSGTVGIQMLWAMITGPFLITFYRYAHNTWDTWCGKLMVRGSR